MLNRSNLIKIFIILLAVFLNSIAQKSNSILREDTLKINRIVEPPKIDGYTLDNCWQSIEWQPIDQVWIPYNDTLNPDDFSGHYKIVWSEEENLLYFLVRITDDVFVDGYKYHSDPEKGDFYYNYDLLEVFIDEDQSGGLHVFDGAGYIAEEWGTNGENSFAYHMNLIATREGECTSEFVACDIAGTDWGNYQITNYADHFPEFTVRKNGKEYIWEFSLAVYDDSYNLHEREKPGVTLTVNKKLGISLAYCDNDDPDENPKLRDNFIGSVFVKEESSNDHWRNASHFRIAKLIISTK